MAQEAVVGKGRGFSSRTLARLNELSQGSRSGVSIYAEMDGNRDRLHVLNTVQGSSTIIDIDASDAPQTPDDLLEMGS